ncbi:hypothetical protein EMIHUDRAFT_108867 [Emiliania huxleyi CCMP1516]|uniref:Glycosyl transferase CAP10 domain-containing protein n=2 Tax=Emiliania huxleyi TaxID=2903 RepID=A0A0D3KU83_EMIH1|nr:hypothetical protein EMIHUDRAFT_108867 [Emiliania huxleyi CCMP1516]EOD39318.1 hypothetical protein EMIHUDRAFT_108867 [Emiliania huxleyi CCMP1516]|eukprot:XP_005791747.1 hypothetical protein EMIHUDRAFT_108867 [Emiliania huxleyi CCMP1516]
MQPASPQCSTVCSDHEPLYAQIREDLAQWDGITRDMIDRAMHRWDESDILATLAVVNGTLWLPRPRLRSGEVARHGDPQLQATIRMILSILSDPALPTPPDLELLINADDYGRVRLKDRTLLPLLSITKELGRGADILYPAGHYSFAGPWISNIGLPPPCGWYALSRLAVEGSAAQRAQYDIGLAPLPLLKEATPADHLSRKYLVSLDGHSYAHRLLKVLATNSLVVKESLNGVSTNLSEVLAAADAADERSRKVAEAASSLVHTHLCEAAHRCYMHRLLTEYGRKMRYAPDMASRPGARPYPARRKGGWPGGKPGRDECEALIAARRPRERDLGTFRTYKVGPGPPPSRLVGDSSREAAGGGGRGGRAGGSRRGSGRGLGGRGGGGRGGRASRVLPSRA